MTTFVLLMWMKLADTPGLAFTAEFADKASCDSGARQFLDKVNEGRMSVMKVDATWVCAPKQIDAAPAH